jgi:hypothetical protein
MDGFNIAAVHDASSRAAGIVSVRAGLCDAPVRDQQVRPETLETRGLERFGVDFLPKENLEAQSKSQSRRNLQSNEWCGMACRVHHCHR